MRRLKAVCGAQLCDRVIVLAKRKIRERLEPGIRELGAQCGFPDDDSRKPDLEECFSKAGWPSPVANNLWKKYRRTEEGEHAGTPGSGIFCRGLFELMKKQPTAHFGEWHMAVHYYQQGYQVLVEKYVFYRKYVEMFERTKAVLGEDLSQFLRQTTLERKIGQPPDLLVYNPREHFFVEVKKPGEEFTKGQPFVFPLIKSVWGVPIKVAEVRRS